MEPAQSLEQYLANFSNEHLVSHYVWLVDRVHPWICQAACQLYNQGAPPPQKKLDEFFETMSKVVQTDRHVRLFEAELKRRSLPVPPLSEYAQRIANGHVYLRGSS